MMNTHKTKAAVVLWMIKRGIFYKYLRNNLIQNTRLLIPEPEYTFIEAFRWDKTPEGFSYWDDINKAFV